jgi:hypothetical protein
VSEPNANPAAATDEAEVNIEAIMQEIRQQIIARRAALAPQDMPEIAVVGKRFPPEFYEHLYLARIALEETTLPPFVSKSPVPIIGGLIDALRAKFHELVVYYVNQSAARQVTASNHLLRALDLMGRTLEDDAPDSSPGDR